MVLVPLAVLVFGSELKRKDMQPGCRRAGVTPLALRKKLCQLSARAIATRAMVTRVVHLRLGSLKVPPQLETQ